MDGTMMLQKKGRAVKLHIFQILSYWHQIKSVPTLQVEIQNYLFSMFQPT